MLGAASAPLVIGWDAMVRWLAGPLGDDIKGRRLASSHEGEPATDAYLASHGGAAMTKGVVYVGKRLVGRVVVVVAAVGGIWNGNSWRPSRVLLSSVGPPTSYATMEGNNSLAAGVSRRGSVGHPWRWHITSQKMMVESNKFIINYFNQLLRTHNGSAGGWMDSGSWLLPVVSNPAT